MEQTKEELIALIEDSGIGREDKDLCRTCIEQAYSVGFNDGMLKANEIYTQTHEFLLSKLRSKL